MINKFIMRRSTEETAALEQNDPTSWTLQRGIGALDGVVITEIRNPLPSAKTSSADVPCVNGEPDLSEAAGQIFYKNKTVQITLQTNPYRRRWFFSSLYNAFVELHGQMVDFAFATALDVEWYYTGRLSVDSEDPTTGKLTVKIDTYPFLQSVVKRRCQIPAATSLDRGSSGWSVDAKSSTATVTLVNSRIVIFGEPGDQVILTRSVSASKRFALGVNALRGGNFRFPDGSRTLGTPSSFGNLKLILTVDGSYYSWTTEGSSDVFMPCLHLDYILTELTLDSDGNVLGSDGEYSEDPRYDPHCAIVLPPNVRIRPEIYNFGDGPADVLLDGTRVYVEKYSAYRDVKRYPAAVLPGIRADRSGEQTVCILSAVGNSSYDTPAAEIRFREEKIR